MENDHGNTQDHHRHQQQHLPASLRRPFRALLVLLALVLSVAAAAGWLVSWRVAPISTSAVTVQTKASWTMTENYNNNHNNNNNNPWEVALGLALERFQNRQQNQPGYRDLSQKRITAQPQEQQYTAQLVHIVRIPQAGSNALSVWARALAGCQPDGYPCCNYHPDDNNPDKRACPLPNLLCPAVRGCTGQRLHGKIFDDDTNNNAIPTLTNIRHPTDRLVAALFFGTPPHRPPGRLRDWRTFQQLLVQPARYRNVLTKLLNGDYAYKPFHSQKHSLEVAQQTACKMDWFGVTERPILSALLLYEIPALAQLVPHPVVFGLVPTRNGTVERNFAAEDGIIDIHHHHHNDDHTTTRNWHEYAMFQNTTLVANGGAEWVRQHNPEDWQLYEFMHRLFCLRVRETPGLVDDAQRMGIAADEIAACQQALSSSSMTVSDLCS